MAGLVNIDLPGESQPRCDIFSEEGNQGEGRFFLRVGKRIGNLMEPMEDSKRREIYMDRIPMGYKVLFDLEAVHTCFSEGVALQPELRPVAEYWRSPVGSFLVIYEHLVEFEVGDRKEWRRCHYRERILNAVEDAEALAKAWGMKVAVARVCWLMDWH